MLSGSGDNSSLAVTVNGGILFLAKNSSASVHAIGGPLTINSGAAAQLGGSGGDQIYTGVTVTNNGTFDLNGQNEGFQALLGSGTVTNSVAGVSSVLTLGENTQATDMDTFSGTIGVSGNSPVALVKVGDGTLALAGSGDNAGLGAMVNSGTLVLAKNSSSTVHAIGGPLTINSGGTVQLGGAGGDQIYTNVTVTNNGAFDLNGQNEGFQALNGSGTVINSSATPVTLTVGENTQSTDSATYSGTLAATGPGLISLNFLGPGQFTLGGSGDNSFLDVTVSGGVLFLAKNSSANVHAVGGSLTINSGAVVELAGAGGDQIYTQASVIDNGTFDLSGQSEGFQTLLGAGAVGNFSATLSTLTVGENTLTTDSAVFSGTLATLRPNLLALDKTGAGTLTLAGNADNAYLGAVVSSGTLVLAKTNSASAHAIGGPVAINAGGTLRLAGSGGDQIFTQVAVIDNGAFDLNGQNEGFNSLLGSGTVANTSTTSNSSLTLGENSQTGDSDTFNGVIGVSGNLPISLTKVGGGTLALAGGGDNFGLAATIQSGALVLAKTSSSSVHAIGGALTINSGGTVRLAGSGGDQIFTQVAVTDNGIFDLNGQNEGFNALLGSGTVSNTSTTAKSSLTLGENSQAGDTDTFSGSIAAGNNFSVLLDKVGAGTLTLAGGGDNINLSATVEAGTLVLAKTSSSTVHAIGGSLTINSGAIVQLAGSGGDQIFTKVAVTNNGIFDLNGQNEGFQALLGSGTVVNNSTTSNATLTIGENSRSGDTDTYNGALGNGPSFAAFLDKVGAGTFTLGGNADNNALSVIVDSGTLVLAKNSSSNVHAIGGPLIILSGGTVQLAGSGGDQIYTSVIVTDNGIFDLNGQTEGFQTLQGAGSVVNSSGTVNAVLTIGENTPPGAMDTFDGPIAGSTLRKVGGGTLTLDGSGDDTNLAATVAAGTLVLAKSSSSTVHSIGGPLVISPGATVRLSGAGGDQICFQVSVVNNGDFRSQRK